MNRILRSQLPPNPSDEAVFDTTAGSSQGRTRGKMSMLLGALFLTILSVFSEDVSSQAISSYVFSSSVGTYTAVTGTTISTTAWDDESTAVTLPIGFSFNFGGTSFTTFGVSNNGWIQLGANPTSSYTPISTWTTSDIIAPFARDLQGQAGSSIQYTTTGSAPNRILTVQWTNYRRYSGVSQNYNFQIQLYETSNVVAFKYGTITPNSTSTTATTSQVGIRNSGGFSNRVSGSNWSASTAGTTSSSTCYANNTVKPASGLTYTWTPPPPCSGTPPAPVASSTIVAPVCGQAVTLTATGMSTGAGISNQWQVSNTAGGPYTNVTGGTGATTGTHTTAPLLEGSYYYVFASTCANSSTTSLSNEIPIQILPTPAPPVFTATTGQSTSGFTANWGAAAGATSYILDVSTSNTFASFVSGFNGLNVGNVTTYVVSGLTASTNYYFRVRSTNGTCNSSNAATQNVLTGYCAPVTTYGCTDGDVIARVILNTLDNNSGTGCPSGTLGYSNYTGNGALTTTLLPSSSYNCTVYAGQYSEGYAAWIDYNDNLVFELSERIGFSVGQVVGSGQVGVLGSSATFPITISCTPPSGVHRLRVRCMYATNGSAVDPCLNNFYGEIEDYLITIQAPPACASPGALTSTGVSSTSASFTWTLGCSTATNYDFEYGPAGFTPGTGTTLTNQAATINAVSGSYTLTGLTASTSYDVYFRANCGGSVSAWSPMVNVFTGHCIPSSSNTGYWLSNVVTTGGLTNFNNATVLSANGYGDYTASQSVSAFAGNSFNLSANYNVSNYYYFAKVWVDWNNDLDFYDAGETMYTTPTYAFAMPFSTSLTVPAGQANGNYRMRVRLDMGSSYFDALLDPCGSYTYGETEDYTLTVTPLPPAPTVTLIDPFTACPGSTIAVTGTDFIAVSAVSFVDATTFVSTPASSFNVISSTQMSVVMPQGMPGGVYSLTITNITGPGSGLFVANQGASTTISGNLALCGSSPATLNASGSGTFAWTSRDQVNMSIGLDDSYGDGWNGGLIDVFVDGVLIFNDLTLATAGSFTGQPEVFSNFTAYASSVITVVPVAAGFYPTECTYTVYSGSNGGGSVLFTISPLPTATQTITVPGSVVSAGSSSSVSAATAGIYTVVFTDGSTGCSATASQSVISQPVPVVTAPTQVSACSGGNAVITASSDIPVVSYTWTSFTSGVSSNTGAILNVGPMSADDIYSIVASTPYCTSSPVYSGIAVVGLSGVVLTPSNITCNGDGNGSFALTSFDCGTAPFTYSVVATGAAVGPFGPIPTNLAAGTYDVYVTDNAGNFTNSPIAITITEPAAILSTTTVTNASICSGLTVGEVTASATGSVTVSSGAIAAAINDYATTTTSLSVAGIPAGVTLTGISVNFNITHTWDSDLSLSLIGPGGVSVDLSSGNGGSGNNYTNTTISSASSNPVAGGAAPFTGTYSPEGALSSLFSNGNGNWTFSAADGAGGDQGTITNWSITLSYNYQGPNIGWYADAAATTQLGTGSTLDVVGTSVCPSPAASGTYNVYAAYALGGCAGATSMATLTVSGLSGVVLTPSNLTCYGSNNGSFSQTQACGTAPFTYSVVATGASAGAYAALPTNLAAGTFDVYVQDNAGNAAGPFAITITQPSALATAVTTDGTACENATIGNVSAIATSTVDQITSFNSGVVFLPGSTFDMNTFETIPGTAVLTAAIPALPAGAVINSVNLVVNGLTTTGFTYDTDINVEVTGAALLTSEVLGSAGNVVTNAGPYTKALSGLTNAGGNVTVNFYNNYGGSATIGSVQLIVNYTIPYSVTWFADAAGTSQIGTGSTLNVIGTSVCPTGVSGSYTVYAAASNGACLGTIVPATLVVGAPLTAAISPIVLANPNITVLTNFTLPGGYYVDAPQTISVPAGATITSASLVLTNVVSGAFAYDTDISVSVAGAATLATTYLGTDFIPLTGENFSYPVTVNPAGGSFTVTLENNSWSDDVIFGSVYLNLSYTLPATGAVCPGASLNLVATTTGGGGTQNLTWYNNATVVGTGSSYIATMNAGDSYTVAVTDECNTTAVVSAAYIPAFENLNGGTISGTTSVLANDVNATNSGVGSYTLTGETAGNTISWAYSTSATGPWVTLGGALNTQNINFTGASGTYYVAAQITSAGGCTAISNALAVETGVLNDDACDAIALTMGNQGGYAFTTAGSTIQTGETAGYGAFSGSTGSIWFKFVAPASGRVSIQSSDNGSTDNYMRIYSTTDCSSMAAFTQLFSDDDSGAGFNAFVTNTNCFVPGQTYYVQVSRYSGTSAAGAYVITMTDLGNTAPVITNVPANVTVNAATGTCAKTATWTAPTVTDDQPNCLVVTSNYAAGASFPVGVTTVTYTATDGQGVVTTASFTVTVNDTQLPTVTPPAAVTVTAALNSCTATATLGSATSVDNCGVTASATNDAPATFPIGNTTVTWSVTDVNGNVGTATQIVTVNVNPANIWYVDADGDNYGVAGSTVTACSQPAGYAANTTDCNDGSASVNPGAAEICGNSIDDNCNGTSEEGCLNPGENPTNATSMSTSIWPNCNAVNGTLVNATASASAQTVCLTGEDKWHQFVATSEGASIVVSSTSADIVIELQTAAGVLVAQENAVAGIGGETLNHYGLTAGQVYKVGVRNYNSALGTGTYSICAKMLKRGGCDYGPGPYTLCQYFKASWAGATGTSYTFTYTGVSGPASGNVYTRTQNSDICVLSTVLPTLPYGSTYNVLITNTYTLNNGAGVAEIISVPGLAPCSMSTATQPVTALSVSNQCAAGPRFRGAIVAALPWVCGSTNWRWEFTELDVSGNPVGLPIAVNRGAASNYINLGTVLQLQYGKTYSVRTAPILAYTGSDYQWGAPVCMSIVGSTGMIADGSQANQQVVRTETANEVNMSLYPNPTHGTDVNINLSGVESDNVQIRVVDAMGRQVWSNRYSVSGVLNTNITFERPLANGLYFVEAIFNGEVQTQRMMVQK